MPRCHRFPTVGLIVLVAIALPACARNGGILSPNQLGAVHDTIAEVSIPNDEIRVDWQPAGGGVYVSPGSSPSLAGAGVAGLISVGSLLVKSATNRARRKVAEGLAVPLRGPSAGIHFSELFWDAVEPSLGGGPQLHISSTRQVAGPFEELEYDDVADNSLIRLQTDWRLTPDCSTMVLHTGIEFFEQEYTSPTIVVGVAYHSERIAERGAAAVEAWTANGASMLLGTIREGIEESAKMISSSLRCMGGESCAVGGEDRITFTINAGTFEGDGATQRVSGKGTILEESADRLMFRFRQGGFYSIPKSSVERQWGYGPPPPPRPDPFTRDRAMQEELSLARATLLSGQSANVEGRLLELDKVWAAQCRPATMAQLWALIAVGRVLGGGEPASAREAFARARELDPTVTLDRELASIQVRAVLEPQTFRKDAAAQRELASARARILASDLEGVEARLLGVEQACGDRCLPATLARLWVLVAVAQERRQADPELVRATVEKARTIDPKVAIDPELGAPGVDAALGGEAALAPPGEPGVAESAIAAAWDAMAAGRVEAAIAHLTAALGNTAQPPAAAERSSLWVTLGILYGDGKRDQAAARQAFDRAFEFDPGASLPRRPVSEATRATFAAAQAARATP